MMVSTAEAAHFHAVKFYKDVPSLGHIVCAFVAEGLRRDEPAVIIATVEHTAFFKQCFVANGIDVERVLQAGLLTVLNADDVLDRFMRDGIPMPQLFAETLGAILTSIASRFPGATIRAYGEMVDLLWQRDQTAAAIRLETLWNDLARSHRFGLLCGYAMGSFYKGSATDDICALHTHVVSDTGTNVSLA
jgi:hypothetical protein